MQSSTVILIYLIFHSSQWGSVFCDGDHAHAHAHEGAAGSATTTTSETSSGGPTGSITTVHTTSGDAGGAGASPYASLLSSLSPELVSSLSRNPQVAQYLRAAGIDVGAATAAKAAAEAGGRVATPAASTGGAYDYPPPPAGGGGFGGFGGPGGFGGFPFFGPYKNIHVSGDFGLAYPFVEKAIIVVGGGLLILVIIALLIKGFAEGGILSGLFGGLGAGFSNALAGSASVDLGPFHKSVSGAGAVSAGAGSRIANTPNNLIINQRVQDSLDSRF